jgi:hypothetical protein
MIERHLGVIVVCMLAGGCVTDLDDTGDEPVVDSIEQAVEPGCTPRPTHYCVGHTVSATYPSPGFPWAPAMYACWDRADIDLGIACRIHGSCCGGLDPVPSNHSHDQTNWANDTWYCTGTINFKYPCTAGSTNPECQPTCI